MDTAPPAPEAPSPALHRPADVYYRAVVGAWRGVVRLRLTDRSILARSGMAPLDRLSVRILAVWPSWAPPVEMATTVAFPAPDLVVHTTRFSWLGVPIRNTEERFHLETDGASFRVSGAMSGTGRIGEDAAGAAYALRWLGVDLAQTTRRAANEVQVAQEGPGFSAEVSLRRVAGAVSASR